MENYSSADYLGQELADVLIGPVSKELSGAKRLAIVPHGGLHFVPFAALPVDKHTLIIDQFSLFYLDSATMAKFTLADHGKPFTRDTKITAIANPQLDGSLLADLPFAEKEGGVIGRYFPQRKLFVGKDATKSRAFDAAPTADILHLAVHGEFRPAAPSESRLLLAPNGANEGSLTVADMFALPLKANMVTLSACDTGLGRISRADDVVGMDRALFYAGAKTVVSSLWRINDVASAVVMKRFYRYLAEGSDKAEAMQKAQLLARKYFQHPAYWSAFRVIGQYQ
jgi:CHAT domain-containing protein